MYHLLPQHSTIQVLALKGEEIDLTRAVVFLSETKKEQGSRSVFKRVIIMIEQRIMLGKEERKDIRMTRDRDSCFQP